MELVQESFCSDLKYCTAYSYYDNCTDHAVHVEQRPERRAEIPWKGDLLLGQYSGPGRCPCSTIKDRRGFLVILMGFANRQRGYSRVKNIRTGN